MKDYFHPLPEAALKNWTSFELERYYYQLGSSPCARQQNEIDQLKRRIKELETDLERARIDHGF